MGDRMMCGDYPLDEVVSCLQKAIRRGLKEEAMYWALEMSDHGYAAYLWRRLAVICVEDCAGDLTNAPYVASCHYLSDLAMKGKKNEAETDAVACAIVKMCDSIKGRMPSDLSWVVHSKKKAGWKLEVPDYAKDKHTESGRRRGISGKEGFFHFAIHGRKCDRELDSEDTRHYRRECLKYSGIPEEGIEELDDMVNYVKPE